MSFERVLSYDGVLQGLSPELLGSTQHVLPHGRTQWGLGSVGPVLLHGREYRAGSIGLLPLELVLPHGGAHWAVPAGVVLPGCAVPCGTACRAGLQGCPSWAVPFPTAELIGMEPCNQSHWGCIGVA